MELFDQINRKIHLKKIPKRIVSLVPSQTELLCDLGVKDCIVGVTKFCVHPNDIKTCANVVGGTKTIHFDKIKALQPDIILCNKEENTKAIVEACQEISCVDVSDIHTLNDSLELIRRYGIIFERVKEANYIIEEIKKEISDFKFFIKDNPTVKVIYFIWKNPWMVAGNNTFIDYLLKLNMFENAYKNLERYPEIELSKSLTNDNIDLILLSSEPFPFSKAHKKELKTFYPNANIILVDGEMFSWYGSRLIQTFRYFKKLHLNLQNKRL